MISIEQLKFLSNSKVTEIADNFGTPVYVYDELSLRESAKRALAFPNAFGLTVRYAMKANPNRTVLNIFNQEDLHIDASSGYEVERAIRAGISPEKIQLTAQEIPDNLVALVDRGVFFNACSLQQLKTYGEIFRGGEVSIRFNPGLGSGGTNRTNVGGPASSFGIWKDSADEVVEILDMYDLRATKIHTHIGSGSDPEVWKKVAGMSLGIVERFSDVTILNLGGGYKVARMSDEKSTDFQEIGQPVKKLFEEFYQRTRRQIYLEIEPGTALVANSGALITRIHDICHTGDEGYSFIKIDAGMTEVTRPALYGAQHPLVVVPIKDSDKRGIAKYIVAGHCCESGDILTPKSSDPEGLEPRLLTEAQIGNFFVIEGAGAYCAGMSTINYNSFPQAAEVLLRSDGATTLIRKRQNLDQMLENEL